jgi:DNA-binding transcriptional LysR family regulator
MINNLRHIRAFLTVARIGNFTRAAAELRLSQSALTVQIHQLEEDLGATLFDRGKRQVTLTQAGKEVRVPLERILVDAEAIVSSTRQMSGLRRGLVSVAVLPSIAARIVPPVLESFTKLYPGIVIQICDVVAERVIEAVKKEEVDFGIASRVGVDRELKTSELLTDRLCAFVPASHLLARRSLLTLKEVATCPIITTGHDSSVRRIIENAFKREKLSPIFSYEVNYMTTAISIVKTGLGIALLPEVAANAQEIPELRCIPITNSLLSRKIEIIQKKDRSLSSAAAKMVDVFKQVAAR